MTGISPFTLHFHGKRSEEKPAENAAAWARRCRIEAVRAIHPLTKEFLLDLAARYENLSGEIVKLDPATLNFKMPLRTASPSCVKARVDERARSCASKQT